MDAWINNIITTCKPYNLSPQKLNKIFNYIFTFSSVIVIFEIFNPTIDVRAYIDISILIRIHSFNILRWSNMAWRDQFLSSMIIALSQWSEVYWIWSTVKLVTIFDYLLIHKDWLIPYFFNKNLQTDYMYFISHMYLSHMLCFYNK